MRFPVACTAALATALLLPTIAAARPQPLDVRVTPVVLGAKLSGYSQVDDSTKSTWFGTAKLEETWSPGKLTSLRITRAASARAARDFSLPIPYRRTRSVEPGGLLEPATPGAAPALTCGAALGQPSVTEAARTTMRMIDEPAKGRVVFTGPMVEFNGPTCAGPDGSPARTLGSLRPDERDPTIPSGVIRSWRTTVPRGAVAAGGLLHFRGFLLSHWLLDQTPPGDVLGTGILEGQVLIDVQIQPVGDGHPGRAPAG
jgi:hypothetical protein